MSRNASRSFERQPTVLDWEREVWRLNQEVKSLKFPPSHIQAYSNHSDECESLQGGLCDCDLMNDEDENTERSEFEE